MKAFILENNKRVQIGGKIYHIQTGEVETVQANRKGIFEDCEIYVEVPTNSLEFAKVAIVLAKRKINNLRENHD